MSFLDFSNIAITGIAAAVPAHIQYRNMELDSRRAKLLLKRTGVKQRHISLTGQTAMDLCYVASKKILERANWDVKSLDGICSITQTPDFCTSPGNAHLLQYRLGMREDIMLSDFSMGCSAFPFGLASCASFLQNQNIKRMLMVCGDSFWYQYPSKKAILRDNEFLHGEGSIAILLERQEQAPPIQIALHVDGSGYKYLFPPFNGIRNTHRYKSTVILPDGATHQGRGGYMDGLEITSFATTTVVKSIQDFLSHEKKTMDNFDGLVLHQANLHILNTIASRLGISMDKVPVSVDRYGNTDGATIPLTMVDAYSGDSRKSLSLLSAGFGVGLSWGVASFEVSPSVIEPMISVEGDIFEEALVRYPE